MSINIATDPSGSPVPRGDGTDASSAYAHSTAASQGNRFVTISVAEVSDLVRAAGESLIGQDLRDVIIIIFNTGSRPRELTNLRWSSVDLSSRFFVAGSRESRYLRKVPFGSQTLEVLQDRRKRQPDSEFVLGTNPERLLRKATIQLAKLSLAIRKNPVRLHELRQVFINRWIVSGGSLFHAAAKFQAELEERE
jgi:integrase